MPEGGQMTKPVKPANQSFRVNDVSIQARGLEVVGLERLYLTGFAPPGRCRVRGSVP